VEASHVEKRDNICDIHEDHPATHWCNECEQAMCKELASLHHKMKSSFTHHVIVLGENNTYTIQKPVLCARHGKPLELVCTQDECLVCLLCVTTTHNSHCYETVDEHYEKRMNGMPKLVLDAKQTLEKLQKVQGVVEAEQHDVVRNGERVKTEIVAYFNKYHNREASLLSKLEDKVNTKKMILRDQLGSIELSIGNIQGALQQLEVVSNREHKTKVLALTEQLKGQLLALDDNSYNLKDHSNMSFYGGVLCFRGIGENTTAEHNNKHSSRAQHVSE